MKKQIKSEYICARNLKLDARYQRELDTKRVEKMKASFNDALLGAVEVARREDGSNVVIDAQHRVATVLACEPDRELLCIVHTGLTEAEEAELFLDLNGKRTKISKMAEYNAALIAQDPITLDIDKEIRRQSLRVAVGDGPRNIRAVAALYRVRRNDNLATTLHLAKTWREAAQSSFAYEGQNLQAISFFLRAFPEADEKIFQEKLCKESPSKMIAKYKLARTEAGIPSREAFVHYMLALYNHRNRKPLTAKQ